MRPETRDRVLEAAGTLGFSPNRHAQSLHSGRSWTVGLMTTDGIGRFSIPVLLGAEDALGAGKISVLLCDTRGDAIREQHHLRTLIGRRVDGIIVTGRRAAQVVLRAAPDTDAFFCGNDQIARGVAEALRERGTQVPDDIAIVGYDNWDSMAQAARPPLTTIDMNLGEIGRIAALRLLAQIDATAPREAGAAIVPCRLIVRESA